MAPIAATVVTIAAGNTFTIPVLQAYKAHSAPYTQSKV